MKKMYGKKFMGILLCSIFLMGCQSESKKNLEESKNDNDFTIATVRWSDWGTDFLEGFVTDSQKEAGIEVNWDIYLSSDWPDKKAIKLAGGDLPDAFLGSNALNEDEIIQNQSLFLPLEDLINENMPNLTRIMEEDPKMKQIATAADGHIYGLPAKLPMRPLIGNQLFINKVWLDNLGLELPQTYDEFISVLEKFRDEDANGNGDKKDEIPFGGMGNDTVFGFILPFNNRIGYSYNMIIDDNGDPVYSKTTENYKKGIAEMHKSYKNGLIDKEIFTQDGTMNEAKNQNPEISRVGVGRGWTADATFGIHANEYVALPALKGPDGVRRIESDGDAQSYKKNEVLILKDAKNPEKLLQWFDKFYTEDASIQNFYGSFGIATEKNEDGTYEVLPPKDGDSADITAWTKSLRDFGPKYVGDGFNEKVTIDDTGGDGLKMKLDQEWREFVQPAFPIVNYTAEELNTLSTLYADIDSYTSQMQSKWVVDGGIEKEWDEYLKTLDKMGFKEFINIQNEAFSRYENAVK